MDHLTPPLLTAIRELRWNFLAGRALKDGLADYFSRHHDELASRLFELWSLTARGNLPQGQVHFTSPYAQALWELIERGHQGQPILEPLLELEHETEETAARDLERHLSTLPFKALIPLLLLQFPAFVTLLIGPLLRDLARATLPLVLVFALWSQSDAFSLTLHEAAVRKFARAKSADEVTRIEVAFEDIRVHQLACGLQLREKRVPQACYQALRLEAQWGLRPSRKQARELERRFDERCRESAARARPADSVNARALSSACWAFVRKSRELWAYKTTKWRED